MSGRLGGLCREKISRLERALSTRGLSGSVIWGATYMRYLLNIDAYGFIYVDLTTGERRIYAHPMDSAKAVMAAERCGSSFEVIAYGRMAELVDVHATGVDARDPASIARGLLSSRERVGINRDGPPFELLSALDRDGRAVYIDDCLRELRAVKSDAEMGLIAEISGVTERAVEQVVNEMRDSHTVNDVKRALIWSLYRNGAEFLAFDPIVALDEDASYPHPSYPMRWGDRPIKGGSVLLIDVGGGLNGYVADMTRVLILRPSSRLREMAEFLESSYWAAFDRASEGAQAREVDLEARRYMSRLGLHRYFTHSLGHGVGVEVHEFPYISPTSRDVIGEGNVFTIEPGVYFKGVLGMRVENTVAVRGGRAHSLMRMPLVLY